MEKNSLFFVILAILVVQYLAHQYLEYLNAKRFKSTLPPELADVFNENDYQKSQQYKQTNYKFGLISDGFSLVVTICFLWFGGFEWVDQLTRSITENTIPMALVFFGIIMFGSAVLGLPFSYYRTFVIEEKYGFNKTTKSTFLSDKLKGACMTRKTYGCIGECKICVKLGRAGWGTGCMAFQKPRMQTKAAHEFLMKGLIRNR